MSDGGLTVTFVQGDLSRFTETPPDPLPPAPAALYAEDRLIVLDGRAKGTRAEFLRGSDGRITWLRLGGRIYARG